MPLCRATDCVRVSFHPSSTAGKGEGGAGTRHADMVDYFIKTYSNEGDRVLDLTCYDAITGERCQELGRNYIGIDRDPHISNGIPVVDWIHTELAEPVQTPEPEPEPWSETPEGMRQQRDALLRRGKRERRQIEKLKAKLEAQKEQHREEWESGTKKGCKTWWSGLSECLLHGSVSD